MGTPFFLSNLVDSNLQRMDGATVDAWPFFPGSKVGKTFIFILFDYFGGVDYQS
jgi:hypothetical protein